MGKYKQQREIVVALVEPRKYEPVHFYCTGCNGELDGMCYTLTSQFDQSALKTFALIWCTECDMEMQNDDALLDRDAALIEMGCDITDRSRSNTWQKS